MFYSLSNRLLFQVLTNYSQTEINTFNIISKIDSSTLHTRLGHVSIKKLNHVFRIEN